MVITHYHCHYDVGNLAVLILESLTASVAKVLTASVANPDICTSDYLAIIMMSYSDACGIVDTLIMIAAASMIDVAPGAL